MLLGHVIWLGCVQESKEAFSSWGPRDSRSKAQALGPSPSRCNVPKPACVILFRDTEESITGQGGVSSQGIFINEGVMCNTNPPSCMLCNSSVHLNVTDTARDRSWKIGIDRYKPSRSRRWELDNPVTEFRPQTLNSV